MPATPKREGRPTLITNARPSRSLSSAARNRRYLITMGLRMVCFGLAVAVDGWTRWVFIAGAAVLPGIAVLLANAVDLRRPSTAMPSGGNAGRELTAPGTVPGSVEP